MQFEEMYYEEEGGFVPNKHTRKRMKPRGESDGKPTRQDRERRKKSRGKAFVS